MNFGHAALAVLILAGCGDDSPTSRYLPASSDELSGEAPPLPEAESFPPPGLPACLSGDAPAGCAASPELPACLEGDPPAGCALFSDWTCAEGWSSATVGEGASWQHAVCSPPVLPSCAEGEAAFPGNAVCQTIGSACPASTFHDASVLRGFAPNHDGSIVYVRPGASGDGSSSAPFGTVGEALLAASAGDIVALAEGTYEQVLDVPAGIAIVGSCAGGTLIAPDDATSPAIRLSDGAVLANLRVISAGHGVVVDATQSVSVSGVEVVGGTGIGLEVIAADSVTFDTVVVIGAAGEGIVISGGSLLGQHVAVLGCAGAGISVTGPASAHLQDVLVSDTEASPSDDTAGVGLHAAQGAVVSVSNAVIARNRTAGVHADGSNSDVSLADVWIGDTREQASDLTRGRGLLASSGAHVHVARTLLDRNRSAGIFVYGGGSTASLEDVVVRDTRARRSDGAFGNGVAVYAGGSATLARVVCERNRAAAVVCSDEGSTIGGEDLIVRDTLGMDATSSSPDAFGDGVIAQDLGAITIERAVIEENRFSGVGAILGGTLEAIQVLVQDTKPEDANQQYGFGAWATAGGRLTLEQSVVRASYTVGVAATGTPDEGSEVSLSDCVVSDVSAEVLTGELGYGLLVDHASELEGHRVRMTGTTAAGILALGEGVAATLEDVSIADVARQATMPAGVTGLGGWGLRVDDGASVACTRCVVRDVPGVAVSSLGGTISADSLLVTEPKQDVSSEFSGIGVMAYQDATIELERSAIVSGRAIGLGAQGLGARMVATDVVVREIRPAYCFDEPYGGGASCRQAPDAVGNSACVAAMQGGEVRLVRFDLSRAKCGVGVGWGGTVSAKFGQVHDNAIGLNVRDAVFDFDAVLTATVRFFDNETNVDSAELQLPQAPL